MLYSEAAGLAIGLIRDFQLRGLISNDWTFQWNRGRRQLALCNYTKKTISLSHHYVKVANHEHVKNSVLHELSHAIAGHSAGHGPEWKRVCLQIGAKPERCTVLENPIPAKYNGTCPTCNAEFKAHRRLKSMNQRLCAKPLCKAKRAYVVWKRMA